MLIKYNNDEDVENRLLKLFEYLGNTEKILQISKIFFHILGFDGAPIPPNAKPLRGQENLYEIRIKFGKDLYRINYFIDLENDYMIILNWYTKADGRNSSNNYNKSKKKKIDKIIEKSIKEALVLKKNYFLNKGNYEFYT